MAQKNLEDVLKAARNPVDLLRNSRIGAYVYPTVPSEFSNWRDEQAAWRKSAVLFDQSHHMVDIYIKGPDAVKLCSDLAINSFANFPVDRAKQFIPCSYSGHVIGDGILFHLEKNNLVFVGRAPTANWIQFHAETGKYRVKIKKDDRSPGNPKGKAVNRISYRFQIQGPNAWPVIEKLNGKKVPDLKFFHMSTMKIKGQRIRTLRHGMAGAPGLEIWGPYKDREKIREAIIAAGEEFGLRQVGSRAYATNTLESGWIPSPLPAIYTGGGMLQEYRDWLGADSYEAVGSIGGSLATDNIEEYYVNPFELGYGFYIGWKSDFIGKDALTKMKDQKNRKKVTLEWNRDDLLKVVASSFEEGVPYKWIDFPQPNYASTNADILLNSKKPAGISMFNGYSFNERCMLSLAIVNDDVQIGDQLTLIWGEPETTGKTSTEPHRQAEIRVRVSPTPYAREARENYAASWRNKSNA
jgi:vanillate/3-O-methylgallate O-demethylase